MTVLFALLIAVACNLPAVGLAFYAERRGRRAKYNEFGAVWLLFGWAWALWFIGVGTAYTLVGLLLDGA